MIPGTGCVPVEHSGNHLQTVDNEMRVGFLVEQIRAARRLRYATSRAFDPSLRWHRAGAVLPAVGSDLGNPTSGNDQGRHDAQAPGRRP